MSSIDGPNRVTSHPKGVPEVPIGGGEYCQGEWTQPGGVQQVGRLFIYEVQQWLDAFE